MIFPNKLTVVYAINMAKQTLNANISSSSGAGVSVDYGFEWTVGIWNSMDAAIVMQYSFGG